MRGYLKIRKILIDSVALYRAHFLYMTVLIAAVMVPYVLIVKAETLPTFVIFLVPMLFLLALQVEIISINLASTSYIDREVILVSEFKTSLKKIIPYTLLMLISAFLTFLGLSFFIIPGIIAGLFFNVVKVDYIVGNKGLLESIKDSVNLLNKGILVKVMIIYIIPTALQFIISLFINIDITSSTLEEDLFNMFPYFVLFYIIIFPVAISFKTTVYYNIIKERYYTLESTN